MRKLGLCLGGPTQEDFQNRLTLAKAVGFEAAFPGIADRQTTNERCEALRAAGIEIDNLHAPFKGVNVMWEEGIEGDDFLAVQLENIDTCRDNGITKTVVHLGSGWNSPLITDVGVARFDKLVDYAVGKGVHVAFENIRKPVHVAWALDHYSKVPEVGFCWDSGHELCYTKNVEFLPIYGDRVICIHLHDNVGISAADEHFLPFDGKRDWKKTAEYLKASAYDGPIMLEDNVRAPIYSRLSLEEYYQRAYDAAYKIREMIEE